MARRLARLLPGPAGRKGRNVLLGNLQVRFRPERTQATGVASRAVRWVERSEVRTSGPTRSRDFGEDKVGKGLERRKGLQGAEPPS